MGSSGLRLGGDPSQPTVGVGGAAEHEWNVARRILDADCCGTLRMQTITKKELIDRIAEKTANKRVVVKRIVQLFLDEIVDELSRGNRLEFRDFGVFESKIRQARTAQNPKTLERVEVPEKRTVKFKVGRVMKIKLVAAEKASLQGGTSTGRGTSDAQSA